MLIGVGVLLLVGVATITAIVGTQGRREETAEQDRVDFFCTQTPSRDIGSLFTAVSESGADRETADGLVQLFARSFDDPPAPIRAEALLIHDRYLATNGAAVTRDEPEVARAIEVVNAWIDATCPVMATSVP